MQVKLTDSAKEDLSEIGSYYFKVGGVTLASRIVAQIKKDFKIFGYLSLALNLRIVSYKAV